MIAIRSLPVRCGLVAFSGLCYALAYPPLGWRWLVIPGIAGLIMGLQDQRGGRARALGWLHGGVAFGVSLSWLFHVFGGMALPLFVILAAFTALFAEMQSRAMASGITGWKLAVFTSVNWSAWEFIRAELFPLNFPWMTAGLAIGPNSLLPWLGVYGVSAIVVLFAALLGQQKWKAAAAPLAVLIAAIAAQRPQAQVNPGDALALKVAGLQFEGVSLTNFIESTKQLPSDVRYVAWPECAVPFDIRSNQRDWNLVQNLCRERNITLTFGTQSRPAKGDTWRNIALTVDPTGVRGEHNKVHTVHLFDDGIPGSTAVPIATSQGKVGTPICFDCDFEGIVRRMTSAGAEMFVVPMMDAESWTAREHEQHAELFRMRACENGRWMFVCGTSGVSQLIDPKGFVHAIRRTLEQGPISGLMRRETSLTIYTRFGWLFPWIILGLAVISWLALIFSRKPVQPAGPPQGAWASCPPLP